MHSDELYAHVPCQHDRVDDRLQRWALWRSRADGDGLGYPGRVSFARQSPSAMFTDREWLPADIDSEAVETDQAVARLPERLRCVMLANYLRGGTISDKARSCGCGRQTFYDRMHTAWGLLAVEFGQGYV